MYAVSAKFHCLHAVQLYEKFEPLNLLQIRTYSAIIFVTKYNNFILY